MSSLRNVLWAAAVAGLIFSPSVAEARFGKRSSSSSSSSSSKKEKKGKVHDATAVGEESSSDDDDDDDRRYSYSSSSRSSSSGARVVSGVLTLLEILAEPRPARATVYVAPELPPEPPPSSTVVTSYSTTASAEVSTSSTETGHAGVRFGVDGGAMGGGTSVNLFLGLEGERVGMDVRGTMLTLPTDDGTPGTDELKLANLHLTYALVARQTLRLRLEGGLGGATAPDLSVMAPSFGLSVEGCLLSSLDGEMRVQVVPFPFQQVDFQAGLALRLKALALRGGWRALYLNDNGLVDDVEHSDALGGPYVGIGLSF